AAPDLKAFLERQLHSNERYEKLRRVLARYREIAAQGGWELIPDGETLKPGMSDWRVPVIRRRLYLTDSLKSDGLSSTAYDEQLVEAVRHFQMRYGLDVDGVLGKETREAMNVPVEAVIRRIIVNMERWRWLPHDLDGVRVGVNIAGFDLGVFKDLRLEMQMPVIVGKTYHKTPIFSDLIKYIEFNPYWNIPPSIARNEMLPRLKQDPRYLVERNIRLFSGWGADARELDSTTVDWRGVSGKQMNRYKFRQDPGLKNALGTVKFMFPNDYNVYLHDTPSHSLFTRPERTFSHGCIRVSKPAELASYLLGGEENGWGIERVMEAINSRKRTVVPLDKPIPIIIAYRTVWLDSEGNVRFNKDVYGRDSILEKALFEDQLWLAPPPKEDVS
ncbi:MAG: L,D-transpeptidase family protein, partial [Pseudomonadota bacterium]